MTFFSIYESYCHPSVCKTAIQSYFSKLNEKRLSPIDLTGKDFNYLLKLVSLDVPVLIWVTIDYVEPETYTNDLGILCYKSIHCVVLK